MSSPTRFDTTTEFPSADAVADIRRAVLDSEIRPPSRWRTLTETSPSGKTLFQCCTCGVVTTAPNKVCGAGCSATTSEDPNGP